MTRRVFVPMLAAQGRTRARDLYYEPAQKKVLGLRYTLYRKVQGQWREAPWAEALRTGEEIRMLFESNTEGELFLLTRGEKGGWEPAAPDLPVAVSPDHAYSLPPTGVWVLDPPAGEDVLFLVFGRKGDVSLASAIERAREGGGEALIAAARARARDLVFEKEPASSKEATRYVVNASKREDAKVVLEVRIRHR